MNICKRVVIAAAAALFLALTVPYALCANITAADTEKEDMGKYWWGVSSHELSDKDRDLIERVVAAESRGTSREGMVGVAQVIRERAESWGMTAREVVLEKAQFAAPYKGKISDEVREAVAAVFDRGERVFAAYTTHFHHTSVNPFWTKSKVLRAKIDTQVFWGIDIEPTHLNKPADAAVQEAEPGSLQTEIE